MVPLVLFLFNRMEIAFAVNFLSLHSVLKWMHDPSVRNVILRQAAASSQDCLHASSFDTFFDDALRYFSPARVLHAVFANLSTHMSFTPIDMMSVSMYIYGFN